MNPDAIPYFLSLDDALTCLFGNNIKILRSDRIAGGDINEAYRLALSDGTNIFMKANRKENDSFFAAEVAGLTAIAKTGTIGSPHILCRGTDEGRNGCSFLLLEYVDRKGRVADYWETFAYGYFDAVCLKKIDRLLETLDCILVEPDYPSLLHGDLWSGNVIAGNDGKAWLIDPAVYVGHAEADLAMTELFGGFPRIFYDAYNEAVPIQPDYSRRRDLYNLYHLLNHLNLFGQTYLPSVKRIIESVQAAIS